MLIGKLALHDLLQGQGLGRQLLVDALSRAVGAVEIVSGRYIVVDAIDEDAVAFYRRHGFTPLPDPCGSRLIMKSSDRVCFLGRTTTSGRGSGTKEIAIGSVHAVNALVSALRQGRMAADRQPDNVRLSGHDFGTM